MRADRNSSWRRSTSATRYCGWQASCKSSLGPSIRVETHFPPELPEVNADANQLELALLNLAINGRDAMPKGGTITIGATKQADVPGLKAGNYLCVSVADTGTGMDEETLKRATEPFFTTKGVGKGTGLGLPMVHGMAEQSGGKLRLKSRLGEGTIAELYLPVAPRETAQPTLNIKTHVPTPINKKLAILHRGRRSPGRPQHIGTARRAWPHSLQRAVRPTRPRHPAPGKENRPDDHRSVDARHDRLELASRIRAENSHMPIILATGYAELAPGEGEGLPRLAKPFGQRELAEAIARAVTS